MDIIFQSDDFKYTAGPLVYKGELQAILRNFNIDIDVSFKTKYKNGKILPKFIFNEFKLSTP